MNESSIKNIKKENTSSSGTTIKYKGNVTIRYVDKKGKTRQISKHNAGKLGLFTFLSLCLAKKTNDAQTYLPTRLCLYNKEINQESNIAIIPLSNLVSYYISPKTYYKDTTGQWVEGVNKCSKVVFSFLVTAQNIIGDASKTCNLLRLVSSSYNPNNLDTDDKYLCAEIDLLDTKTENGNLNEEISLNLDSNILVYWELTFE